ncbi:MAG TPA: glycosyltransferase family 39 protein [Acidimicrobiales bacterium]|nr:glycosyltransferase family 39 protein [Acidimicrobiales bacterium]
MAAVALGARLLLGLVVAAYLAATDRPWLFPDEGTYMAEAASGRWKEGHGYSAFLARVFDVAGQSAWLPKGINIVAGALVAVVVYEIASRLIEPARARVAGLAVACWPSLVLWSVLVLKDTLVLLAVLVVLLAALRVAEGEWAAIGVGVLALAALEPLRLYAFVVAALAVAAPLVVRLVSGQLRRALPLALFFLAVSGLLVVTGHGLFGTGFLSDNATVEQVAIAREEGSRGDTGFAEPDVRDKRDVIKGLPRGATYAMVGPFPWDPLPPAGRLLVVVELPAWVAAIVLAARGARRTGLRALLRSWSALVAFALGILAVLSVFEGNAGTALRQRALVIPVVLCLAVLGPGREMTYSGSSARLKQIFRIGRHTGPL